VTLFVSGSANSTKPMQNAHGLKQRLVSAMVSASEPHGSKAKYASSHTFSSLFASDWPSHFQSPSETMSPAQPSHYENSSAPPRQLGSYRHPSVYTALDKGVAP
jgi:hypothetical protein